MIGWSVTAVVVAAESGLLVALGGTNRILIVGTLVGLFTASVVAFHLRPVLFERARSSMKPRDWMAPPPSPLQANPSDSTGFVPDDHLNSVRGLSDVDEPTNYEELSNVSRVRTGEQPVVRSWSREVLGDEIDVLDLQLASYIPGFRDEYFLAEAKDSWMKRFHRRRSDTPWTGGVPAFPVQFSTVERVADLGASLIESVVSSQHCMLKVRFRAVLVSDNRGQSHQLEEVWTYACSPQIEKTFAVVDVTHVSGLESERRI